MNNFPFELVGFDLDGTLLDTSGDLGAALNHALRMAGRPEVPVTEVSRLIGGGGRRMVERALEESGGVPHDFEDLAEAFMTYYGQNLSLDTRLFPGGEQALDDLAARGVRLAVVTNKREDFAVRLLTELGLAPRFFTIIGGDTLGPGRTKPAPDLLLEMLARAGAGSSCAAFVGDTTYDTRAAHAAGLPCIALSFGFNDLPAHELGATMVIDHYDELIPALLAMGQIVAE